MSAAQSRRQRTGDDDRPHLEGVSVAIARLEERVDSLCALIDEREKQVSVALASAEKAVAKAEEAQQRVNITQNEFRAALKDQAEIAAVSFARMVERLATKDELEALSAQIGTLATSTAVDQVVERIQALERAGSVVVGREKGGELLKQIVVLMIGAAITFVAMKLGAK